MKISISLSTEMSGMSNNHKLRSLKLWEVKMVCHLISFTHQNRLMIVLMAGMVMFIRSIMAQIDLPYDAEVVPPDNPLKGLVPYASNQQDRFPHSMEFSYVPLSELVTGEKRYDWRYLEKILNEIATRRHQAVFRVWMEYPGHRDGIPAYLEERGVKVTEWMNTNTAPFPPKTCRTPDYCDPRVRTMLVDFIHAMGEKYDGDPRIGFITAGLLGTWGEWHTHPRTELMADNGVQAEVMDAYAASFKKTPILLRYPAGEGAFAHAANHLRPFGYHDDSFAWATLDTGRKKDSWFFVPSMIRAGTQAINKWKLYPIGGEIRPELWGVIFDAHPAHPNAQDFTECVQQTHVSWLMDTGMFRGTSSVVRIKQATEGVRKMGYVFHVARVQVTRNAEGFGLQLQVENRGVAPFYYDWDVEVGCFTDDGQSCLYRQKTDWRLRGILPDESMAMWKTVIAIQSIPQTARCFAVR
ncbi:MAG: DUF4832 domain-containing protein, partial [Kiritimatiellae bacterium]|nr:DUF4832 domain-containing protein [Kiritimatiellia bacterium]